MDKICILIETPAHRYEVQKYLFSMGCGWGHTKDNQARDYNDIEALFITRDGKISFSDNKRYSVDRCKACGWPVLKAEDVLNE